jgi:hypothetical protein
MKDKRAWKQMKDYEYLIGLVYFDPNRGASYMTTRITEKEGKFISYRQKVEGKTPVGAELSETVLVEDVEIMLLGLEAKDKRS